MRRTAPAMLGVFALLACNDGVIGRVRDAAAESCEPLVDASSAASAMAYAGGEMATTGSIPGGRLNGGRQFAVTAECIHIVALGAWDHNQDGLSRAHTVALFALDGTGASAVADPTPLASAEVQAGSEVPLEDGFRFADLASPLRLEPGFYAVIAYDFSSEEPFGDGGSEPDPATGIRHAGFDPFEFTTAPSPAYPAGGDANQHSMATFRFR